jgi:hypothetical protein
MISQSYEETYLCVQLVKDILEVVTLHAFLRVEKLQELLNELGSHKDLELPDLN